MDEAVLRIVLQDSAQGTTSVPSGSTAPAPTSFAPQPPKSQTTAGISDLAGADVLVKQQDYASNILAGAQKDLKRFQKEQKSAELAGLDAQVRMQDYARSILAGAQKDLEKFQAEQAEGKAGDKLDLFKSLANVAKSGLQGDLSGAVKGLTGKGGALEAMGIGTEALAAAAPPVAIALVAKEIGDRVNKAIVDGIKQEIGRAGEIAASIAQVNQDVTAPIEQLGNAATAAGEKIDAYVPIAGKLIIATGAAGKALAEMMRAIDSTVKHYEQYSTDIAMASAQAEVRQVTRDLARAQLLGGNLAAYTTAKSKLENDVEDIKAKMLNLLLPSITAMVRVLDLMLITSEKIAGSMELMAEIAIEGPKLFVDSKKRNEILERIHNLLDKRDEEIVDPTAALFVSGAIRNPSPMADDPLFGRGAG